MEIAATFHRFALVAVAALGFFATVALTGDRAPEAAAVEASSSIGALRICSTCASAGGDLSRYRYVVLNAWDHARISTLRANNPNLKILVYKDLPGTLAYACQNGVDNEFLAAGVGYCAANAAHPEWFLKDTAGQRIEFCDFPGVWQMDPGNPEYQNAWLSNVSAELKQYGWDGVMLDDTNSTERYHLCGRTIAKYPAESDYQAATRSFLARVGPALTSQGSLALPNINFDCWEACWTSYIQYTSGAFREWWTKSTTGAGGQYADNNWDWSNGFLRLTQEQGKIFIAVTYAPQDDVRSQRYARASFLLDWNGGPSALVFEPSPEAIDPWSSEWTADIGTPRGAKYAVGGAWRRDFSAGTVIVNPSSTTSATVDLGGTFTTADGSSVKSIALAPMTGAILRPAASPQPTTSITTTTTTTTAPVTTTTTATATPLTTTTTTTTPTATAEAPVNLTPPAIAKSRNGSTLTATTGDWRNATQYAYQWLRCDASGAACALIGGATGSFYTLTAAELGGTVRVLVTATGPGGSASAISQQTALILTSGKAKGRKLT